MEQQTAFQQAREQMMNMLGMGGQMSSEDQESIQHALQAAYQEATPEEKEELKKLEQQLKTNH